VVDVSGGAEDQVAWQFERPFSLDLKFIVTRQARKKTNHRGTEDTENKPMRKAGKQEGLLEFSFPAFLPSSLVVFVLLVFSVSSVPLWFARGG